MHITVLNSYVTENTMVVFNKPNKVVTCGHFGIAVVSNVC